MSAAQATLAEEARTHRGLATLLAALATVSPFSIDIFFPSFPAIAAQFALSAWQMQQTLTAYLVPFAIMALVLGPLSDALGRRPVVLAGLAIYAAASIGCALAPSFAWLLAFRALQGMSAGVGMAIGRAIVRDLHDGPEAQRLMSTITMIFGIAPAIAPVIGGWIHVAFGWRSVFGFMVLIGVTLMIVSYVHLPETHPEERRAPLHPGYLARTAWRIASHQEFILLALAAGMTICAMMTYLGAAPAIVLGFWHLQETEFAWLFAPIIAGFMLGAWLSGRLAGRLPGRRQIVAGFTVSLGSSAVLLALHAALHPLPIVVQETLIGVDAVGVQLVMPILVLRMLDLFPGSRGSAASVQSCVMLLTGAGCIGLAVPALAHSLWLLAAGSLACTLSACGLWNATLRLRR
ncbi:MAG TPA: multidrug effflux MFS transporter [Steroidobacteraceae bacterium]|jgi:DHA1 family bicyclomycin/chloramphenicol resistance-like MFS transporter|nr:multidrug effflux MFS transporter [Steroidobacteraceae bacterium]